MSDPTIARLLTECLSPEPKLRPTALQLLARLKKVQRQRVVYRDAFREFPTLGTGASD
jgi:hypothetical protein